MIGATVGAARQVESAAVRARVTLLSSRWEAAGFRLADADDLARLRSDHGISLGAGYTAIHVNSDPGADMVARAVSATTGVDKRYYSAAFTAQQQAAKFSRVRAMEPLMPAFDAQLLQDARTDDTAASVLVMRRTGMRPGSDIQRSGKPNPPDTFGATNLRAHHVSVAGDDVRFSFVGKGAKPLALGIEDAQLGAVLSSRLAVRSGDERLFATNEDAARGYVHLRLGSRFESKDLRTLHATSSARAMVAAMDVPATPSAAARSRRQVATRVSTALGNTPAMALKAYIDPAVFTAAGWPA